MVEQPTILKEADKKRHVVLSLTKNLRMWYQGRHLTEHRGITIGYKVTSFPPKQYKFYKMTAPGVCLPCSFPEITPICNWMINCIGCIGSFILTRHQSFVQTLVFLSLGNAIWVLRHLLSPPGWHEENGFNPSDNLQAIHFEMCCWTWNAVSNVSVDE